MSPKGPLKYSLLLDTTSSTLCSASINLGPGVCTVLTHPNVVVSDLHSSPLGARHAGHYSCRTVVNVQSAERASVSFPLFLALCKLLGGRANDRKRLSQNSSWQSIDLCINDMDLWDACWSSQQVLLRRYFTLVNCNTNDDTANTVGLAPKGDNMEYTVHVTNTLYGWQKDESKPGNKQRTRVRNLM
eukprot:2758137-Amphidinium_carterae.1